MTKWLVKIDWYWWSGRADIREMTILRKVHRSMNPSNLDHLVAIIDMGLWAQIIVYNIRCKHYLKRTQAPTRRCIQTYAYIHIYTWSLAFRTSTWTHTQRILTLSKKHTLTHTYVHIPITYVCTHSVCKRSQNGTVCKQWRRLTNERNEHDLIPSWAASGASQSFGASMNVWLQRRTSCSNLNFLRVIHTICIYNNRRMGTTQARRVREQCVPACAWRCRRHCCWLRRYCLQCSLLSAYVFFSSKYLNMYLNLCIRIFFWICA